MYRCLPFMLIDFDIIRYYCIGPGLVAVSNLDSSSQASLPHPLAWGYHVLCFQIILVVATKYFITKLFKVPNKCKIFFLSRLNENLLASGYKEYLSRSNKILFSFRWGSFSFERENFAWDRDIFSLEDLDHFLVSLVVSRLNWIFFIRTR